MGVLNKAKQRGSISQAPAITELWNLILQNRRFCKIKQNIENSTLHIVFTYKLV